MSLRIILNFIQQFLIVFTFLNWPYYADATNFAVLKQPAEGRASSCRSETSTVCGFGYLCVLRSNKRFQCVEDFSHPEIFLRDASDQGPCDFAGAMIATHTVDDLREITDRSITKNTGWARREKIPEEELTSLGMVKNCVTKDTKKPQMVCKGSTFFDAMKFLKEDNIIKTKKVPYRPKEFSEKLHLDPNAKPNRYLEEHSCDHVLKNVYPNDQHEFPRPKDSFPDLPLCFNMERDLMNHLRRHGPVPVDFQVFPELLNLHDLGLYSMNGVSDTQKNVLTFRKLELFKEENMFRYKHLLGMTNVLISGYGSHLGETYFIAKFPWGEAYAYRGYLKIDSDMLFKRYLLPCSKSGLGVAEFRQNLPTLGAAFPKLGYMTGEIKNICANSGSENHLCTALFINRANEVNFITTSSAEGKLFIDDRFSWADDELYNREDDIPELRFVLRQALTELSTVSKDPKRCFYFTDLSFVEVSIVSGRKFNLLMKFRTRQMSSHTSCSSVKYSFLDEKVNLANGFEVLPTFFYVSLWIPLAKTPSVFNTKRIWETGAKNRRIINFETVILERRLFPRVQYPNNNVVNQSPFLSTMNENVPSARGIYYFVTEIGRLMLSFMFWPVLGLLSYYDLFLAPSVTKIISATLWTGLYVFMVSKRKGLKMIVSGLYQMDYVLVWNEIVDLCFDMAERVWWNQKGFFKDIRSKFKI